MKRILILITASFLLAMPMEVKAQDIQQRTTIEQEVAPITISVNESTIHIKNAEKMVIEIYNMAGVKVVTQRIDSSDKAIELDNLPKGCYIIKIGKRVERIDLYARLRRDRTDIQRDIRRLSWRICRTDLIYSQEGLRRLEELAEAPEPDYEEIIRVVDALVEC